MKKILNLAFHTITNQKCMFAFVSIISIMLLPSTFLHCLPLKIEAQTSLLRESINISNNTAISHSPQLAVSQDKNLVGNDSVYVVWSDNSTGNGDIYFKRSADNGTTFGSTQNLSNNPGNSTAAQMAAYQDNVYVVWEDASTGNGDIYFRKSIDNGNSFSTIENLSNNTSFSDSFHIAVSGSDVYVVWSDNSTGNGDIYFRKSIDKGTTFDTIENLSNDNGKSYGAHIVLSGNNVYVVWNDNSTGNGDIYFKRSADNGTTFGSTQNLSNNPGNSTAAQMAAYQDNVYVVWEDASTGNGDIYFKASLDNGTKFAGQKSLARNNGSSFNPQLAVSPNNIIYGLWQDNTQYDRSKYTTDSKAADVLYRVSLDSGRNFTARNTIGKDIGDAADFAQIATAYDKAYSRKSNDAYDAYVVWGAGILKNTQPLGFVLFYQTIANNGTTLSDPINLSNSNGNSIFPKIAVSNQNNVYVVWSDDTTGNGDVFFTRAN
jgi:hypothetical protein